MNAHFKCLTCGQQFWCRVRGDYGEPYSDAWELADKDGDMCDHVRQDGGNVEITEMEPYD